MRNLFERYNRAVLPSSSIVIRALNEAEHLPALFSGLLRQTETPDEIILVDSGSTDDSVAIAEAHGASIVRINPDDFSFGRALNVGCEVASSEILVFLSAHVYPLDEHWLENLLRPFESTEVVSVYGRQTGDHRSHFSEIQLMRQWFPERSIELQTHPFCNNANCAVRRSWWERLPYDEQLTGLEDLDWASRAMAEGGKLSYRADAIIAHVHQETWNRTRNRYRREAIAMMRISPGERLSAPSALWLCVANIARDYVAAVPRRCLMRNLLSIPSFRTAQYLGAWEGFRMTGEISAELRRRFYYPKRITPINERLAKAGDRQ